MQKHNFELTLFNYIFKFELIVLFTLIFSLNLNCAREEEVKQVKEKKDYPTQEGWNSTLIATRNGKKTAIIKYGYMSRYDNKKVAYFDEGVEVDFFNEKGEQTSKLTSQKGQLDEKTNTVTAMENVVVVSDSGITLKTEKLWWDNALERVKSDQFVTITTIEDDTLYGVGFESDQTLSNWMLLEPRGKTDKGVNLDFSNQKEEQVEQDSTKK